MKLYEISNEIAAILGHEDDELSDDVAARLATLEINLESKVDNILQFRQGLLAEQEAVKGECERLQARQDALTRKAELLKKYVLTSMQTVGVAKIKSTLFSASVCKSPPRVEVTGDNTIPEEYSRVETKVSLDKAAVLADWKAGKDLPPGLEVVQGVYLKIS